MSKLALALTVLALFTATPAPAGASQSAKLHVTLTPERLGASTTIVFSFRIAARGTLVPSPLTALELYYPANIGLVTSGLGLETCTAAQLETLGRCPPDSLMGYGKALVQLAFGPQLISEEAHITTWMAPVQNGHLAMLLYAEAPMPVSAERIFTAQLLQAPAPYGGQLAATIPVIETLPGAPDAAVVQMTTTIGPKNVTYYSRYHGKRVAYHPNGLRLPETCPRTGFPFAATFTFLDGTHTNTKTTVPCPAHLRRTA